MLALPLRAGGRRTVLFYAESPVKYAMFRPLHERLNRDPRVQVFFAGKLRGGHGSSAMAKSLGVLPARAVPRGVSALHKFDALVTADYELWAGHKHRLLPASTTPRVQLFHGVSARNGGVAPKMTEFQHLFCVGPYMVRRFVAEGWFAPGDPRLHEVGMPKVDRLVDGSPDRARAASDLGFDPAKPTVLLAPTWLKWSAMHDFGEELIAALAAGPWNLLIKLHDKFFDPRFNLVDWRARLEPLRRRENCRVVEDFDAIPYMLAADLMVSDLSSVCNEFALLDRPLVYLALPDVERVRKQYPRLDLETWGQRAGDVVDSPRACVAAVERALADPAQYGEIRRALAADLFFHPGRATDAAMRALLGALGLDEALPRVERAASRT